MIAPPPATADTAIAWIDHAASPLDSEPVSTDASAGRILADAVRADAAIPLADCAAVDGFAVRAAETVGASPYNPLALPLIAVAAGEPMPVQTDAVVALEMAEPAGAGMFECVEPVAPGDNVWPAGSVAMPGAVLAVKGARLDPRHIGLLIGAGISVVPAVRRPRVRIVTAPPHRVRDRNGAMIRAAAARDGGLVELTVADRTRAGIAHSLTAGQADIVLVIGGTGPGADDHAADALRSAGELALHGVALRPGGTVGLGRIGRATLVVLLPGPPPGCLFGYEVLAGRAIRRLGGRHPRLPHPLRAMTVARKIVSAIGASEFCPVRRVADDTVEPLPSFAAAGLMSAAAGDGFVIVPATSEGYPEGSTVTVHLYEGS
jgi:molybdopterin molybdotransferase